jgi:ectoine hydroxylase-related dioxygenase (phytanoyl-CoA dioxygenase family)
MDHQTRLGGLPRLHAAFDSLIAHPRILPFLRAFMDGPQLINTWSISKRQGHAQGNFHAGAQPHEFSVDRSGKIHSKMLNIIWMLTDNGINDGCVTLLPGSHKSALPVRDHLFDPDGKLVPAKDLPGAVPMLASAGSVLVMSECTLHTGLPKTTVPVRSNLYYNYMETDSMNPMSRAPYFGYSECGKLCAFSGVSMAQSWFDFPRRLCIACTRSSTIV